MSETLRQFVSLNSGGCQLSVPSIQTGVKSDKDLAPNSPSAGNGEVIPGSLTSFVTVSAVAAAPEVFISSIPSASTLLVVGANEVVTQTALPSLNVSETVMLDLDLKLPRSPESTPQDAPSPDSSSVGGLDYTQEKVWCLSVHVRRFLNILVLFL